MKTIYEHGLCILKNKARQSVYNHKRFYFLPALPENQASAYLPELNSDIEEMHIINALFLPVGEYITYERARLNKLNFDENKIHIGYQEVKRTIQDKDSGEIFKYTTFIPFLAININDVIVIKDSEKEAILRPRHNKIKIGDNSKVLEEALKSYCKNTGRNYIVSDNIKAPRYTENCFYVPEKAPNHYDYIYNLINVAVEMIVGDKIHLKTTDLTIGKDIDLATELLLLKFEVKNYQNQIADFDNTPYFIDNLKVEDVKKLFTYAIAFYYEFYQYCLSDNEQKMISSNNDGMFQEIKNELIKHPDIYDFK